MNICLNIFQEIELNTDAIVTVRGEDFDSLDEGLVREEVVLLSDHQTIATFWQEVSAIAEEFRDECLCPILCIDLLMSEVIYDRN